EALADDMRARFTDRLHSEGHAPEPAPEAPIAAEESADDTVPLRAQLPVSEITLQGVGSPALRPSTSPGFAAAASSAAARALPRATRPSGGPSRVVAGGGEGIPEPVVAVEGEPAIVIPFPTLPGAAVPPVEAPPVEEPRTVVAGEIVSRKSAWSRDSRASEE